MVRRPDGAFCVSDPEEWHYSGQPKLEKAQREHDVLVGIIENRGVDVIYHDEPLPGLADSVFVHDPVLVTRRGAILLKMGKDLRRGEEDAIGRALGAAGVPTIARLEEEATAEGGDLLWLDRSTLVAGVGFRTNREGIRQLKAILEPDSIEVIPVDLPYFQGPEACLHLMSVISLVDHDLAVVYPQLLPVVVWKLLEEKGVGIVEVPEEEFLSMGTNVLALAPRDCVLLEGNPRTAALLEQKGCRVATYPGYELSLKAEGGPTCLTRPILRC
jgi:N-dimethylarginine dimethylaminohydrolase